jgi:hypothetical protein
MAIPAQQIVNINLPSQTCLSAKRIFLVGLDAWPDLVTPAQEAGLVVGSSMPFELGALSPRWLLGAWDVVAEKATRVQVLCQLRNVSSSF